MSKLRPRRSLIDRFEVSYVVAPNGCWIWTGTTKKSGYGQLRADTGKLGSAHRLSYELFVGPIPDGYTIDHLCRQRNCVNWRHLEPVTLRVNILRGTAPSAVNATKTHCLRGHAFSADNTKLNKNKRYCRECKRQSCRDYNERKKRRATQNRAAY